MHIDAFSLAQHLSTLLNFCLLFFVLQVRRHMPYGFVSKWVISQKGNSNEKREKDFRALRTAIQKSHCRSKW